LVNHPRVNKIAFTGSTDVGKHIMCQASNSLKRVTLELGGKSPNIILPDADRTRAIPGAMNGLMMHQGEDCSAGAGWSVQKKAFDNVMAELVEHSKKIKQGAGMDQDTQMGPLVSREQRDRVVQYINKGKEEGAELLTGGTHTDKGYFVEPTVFADVDD